MTHPPSIYTSIRSSCSLNEISISCGPHIHPTPKDLNSSKRGIQELSSFEADVDAKLIKLSGEYQSLFDDKGSKCKPWASEQKLYCESLNEKLSCLKQKLSKAVTDIKNNLTPSVQALRRFSAAKGKKRTRSQKENIRKAKKRKQERLQAAVFKTMKNITLNLWTIENLSLKVTTSVLQANIPFARKNST